MNGLQVSTVALGMMPFSAAVLAGGVGPAQRLSAVDASAGDAFGRSVEISGNTIVVGAPHDDDGGSASGSAYLFDADSGVQRFKIEALDGQAGDQFGFSVASDEGVVVVGAYLDDDNGVDSGCVYLFDVSTGDQIMKIVPDDGAAGDQFGYAVAIDDGLVVIGAKRDDDQGIDAGAVYVFDADTGTQLYKVTAADGVANDNFGGAVAIDNGLIAVGAHAKWNGPLFLAGAAYVFDALNGDQLHKLLPTDAATSDFFGFSIDIDDEIIVVGAWSKSIVFDHSGAAYLFDAMTGDQIGSRLTPGDASDRDNFGYAVGIDNGVVAISAPGDSDDGVFEAGSVYVFDAGDGQELAELYADPRAPLDQLGSGIAIDDGSIVAGADRADDNGDNSGSAYVFALGGGAEPADLNGDGVVDSADLALLLAAWGASGPGDLDDDGAVGAGDLAVLIAAWG